MGLACSQLDVDHVSWLLYLDNLEHPALQEDFSVESLKCRALHMTDVDVHSTLWYTSCSCGPGASSVLS